MSLPPGFRFRSARDQDAAPASALANEESRHLLGFANFTEDRLRRFWTAPSVDRERDVAVIEAPDGRVAGCLFVIGEPPFVSVFAIGFVGLPYQGRGIGAAIVADNERRAGRFVELAPPERRVVVHAGTLAGLPATNALFRAAGYEEVRRFELMRTVFDGAPCAPAPIPGIEVRGFLPGDERTVYETHIAAFSDHWGEGTETYEDFAHHVYADPTFDPAFWWVAHDGDRLAGYVGARLSGDDDPELGYVGLLGVLAPYRRRGIGEALLRRTFRALHDRGQKGCDLHVDADSLTGATRLYERVGMTAHPRFVTWEKELRPGT